jgi:AraC-like DNA-binding protein
VPLPPLLPVDPAVLRTFDRVIDVYDPMEMDNRSRVSERLLAEVRACGYLLQDRSLPRTIFDDPITIMADRRLGSILIALTGDRFAVRSLVGGEGIDRYCFTLMLQGRASVRQGEIETIVTGPDGAAFHLSAGTRLLVSDNNARQNLLIKADALEHALEGMLGERLRKPLQFKPAVNWTRGLAASLRLQLDFLMHEMTRHDGAADNPVALASFTDLIMALVLQGMPHNYLERLKNRSRSGVVPAYVRRAEDFMHANAAAPIRMEQVADAAGCSVRTLGAVFRRFRDTTPLAALHAIRLERIQAELRLSATGGSTAEVARRYGFTNGGRFSAAYRRRFGEAPLDTAGRGFG